MGDREELTVDGLIKALRQTPLVRARLDEEDFRDIRDEETRGQPIEVIVGNLATTLIDRLRESGLNAVDDEPAVLAYLDMIGITIPGSDAAS
ncbi:MAG TPA: hypothetical protein VJL27_01305 [Patescibacteria group bacterium]|nr:hypothetical protein [Patescibacteria group bacterium]